MNHIKSLYEYYNGQHSTIGFRYSEPKLKSNTKFLVFGDNDLKKEITEKLDILLDNYTLNIKDINDNDFMEQILYKMPEFVIEKIVYNKYNFYEISIDLVTYDEDEIYSLFLEFANKQDTYIVAPILLVNDKPYDQNAKFNAKSKIGFKK